MKVSNRSTSGQRGSRFVISARFVVLGAFLVVVLFFFFHATWFHVIFDRFHKDKDSKEYASGISLRRGTDVGSFFEGIPHKPASIYLPQIISRPISSNPDPQPIDKNFDFHLPGATNHPILRLSDKKFRELSVDTMMGWYGQAEGGGSCAEDFGNNLVMKWRATKKTFCHPKPNTKAAMNTKVDCYLVHQTRHHGNGDNLCVYNNVAVNMQVFNDEQLTTSVIEKYVNTRHAKQPYLPFPRGFITGDCEPGQMWKVEYMPGWNADWTVGAYTSAPDTPPKCDVWIEHPVHITQRDTFANFFHDSEDFVNVFLAMAILKYSRGNTQHYLTDLYPQGSFWAMWSQVYSPSPQLPTNTAWDLKATLAQHKQVCFRNLSVGIYGPAAPMTVASWDTPCKRTALMRAWADFVIRGLGLQAYTHYAMSQPSKVVRVSYLTRRPSDKWPEYAHCNDTHSFFKCRYWETGWAAGKRQLGRMLQNDQEVVKALQDLEAEYASKDKQVKVSILDYNKFSFSDQIREDIQTDILIGPHGAGLMHVNFLPDRGQLIELFVDGSAGNRHFHNMASWSGKRYRGESMENPVGISWLLGVVRQAIEEVDVNSY